ncbi:hypothetical protein [Kitasatospora sp. McL0602]|uniref:hypothetical protein n=1 Tax=Kitasatospora sp. McL0602 TaxID=3439530 RepID=UPI003F8BC4AF
MAVLATRSGEGAAYPGELTSSPPTTAAADSVAASCSVARRGPRRRSARTDASNGSVPFRSAINRSAVRGAN